MYHFKLKKLLLIKTLMITKNANDHKTLISHANDHYQLLINNVNSFEGR